MTDIKARLIKAADRLDQLADGAEYKKDRWYVDVAGPIASLEWLGLSHDVLTATWPQAALVDAMSPALARLLARWLRTEATYNAGDEVHDDSCQAGWCQAVDALALADHILKVKETSSA